MLVDAPEVLAEAEDVVEFATVAEGVTGAEKTVGVPLKVRFRAGAART